MWKKLLINHKSYSIKINIPMVFPHNDRNTYVCVCVYAIGYLWDVQNSEFKMGSFLFHEVKFELNWPHSARMSTGIGND